MLCGFVGEERMQNHVVVRAPCHLEGLIAEHGDAEGDVETEIGVKAQHGVRAGDVGVAQDGLAIPQASHEMRKLLHRICGGHRHAVGLEHGFDSATQAKAEATF